VLDAKKEILKQETITSIHRHKKHMKLLQVRRDTGRKRDGTRPARRLNPLHQRIFSQGLKAGLIHAADESSG
jgi:hypothetical protein